MATAASETGGWLRRRIWPSMSPILRIPCCSGVGGLSRLHELGRVGGELRRSDSIDDSEVRRGSD